MKSTTFHIHVPIQALLNMNDDELSGFASHPDGFAALRSELRDMLSDGEYCLVLDNECDNKNPDGSCAGHITQTVN
ncbi:hypothetical protein A6D98_09855 [Aliivibrio fischeri]|uniref:hypothetical protein n=1 Tax=Aliivibrio fischeri TaxID=668 RepID=UPI00080E68D1|nr:hypothetical protein [Aliivibrio fischeri]OCH60894.1 hypothetical protein A6D98_09855 [Aliivibrio fischeri]